MIILDLVPGSDEWIAVRKDYFCASEAPAMMNESKYISRNQLLDHKKGWTTEVDAFTKRLFNDGHDTEQAALPIVEKLIEDELYPVVGVLDGTRFLASFDGLTMLEDIVFEHKIFNKVLAENVANNLLEPHYYWQLEHQLLVSGADKAIFVTSDGTEKNMKHMFYESVPERRQALIAGWVQFDKDLQAHVMQAKTEKVVAEEITDLPTISYKMNGLSLVSNLEEFKAQSDSLVELSKKPLETDQDFANAESRQKVFTKAEADIKALADRVLGEVADIDAFTKDLRYIGEQIRQARLAEGKQIKERKEQLRYEIANKASEQVRVFIEPLSSELKLNFGFQNQIIVDAMKGKRTIESLQDAADSAVAQIKIDITEQANTARANLATLKEHASDCKFLFNDWAAIAFKACEDFTALVRMRIVEHKEAEEKRFNAERERIRAEEKAKAEREAEAKAKQERLAQEQAKAEEVKSEEFSPNPEHEEDLTPSNWMEAQVKHAQKVHAESTATLNEYQRGYLDGMKAYAWWKNGVEYVGTGGQTYEAAADLFLKRKCA